VEVVGKEYTARNVERTVGLDVQTTCRINCPNLSEVAVRFTDRHTKTDVAKLFGIKISQEYGETLVTYYATRTGEFFLHLIVRGYHVPGSPFPVNVLPTDVDPIQCSARGPGLSRVMVNFPGKFAVSLVDLRGNLCSSDMGEVTLKFIEEEHGADEYFDVVQDVVKGYHVVQITGSRVGVFDMHVLVNGRDIRKSPFRLQIFREEVDPRMCSARGEGLVQAVVGTPAQFGVTLAIGNGTPCDPRSEPVAITWYDHAGEDVDEYFSLDIQQTQYSNSVTYTPQRAGDFHLHVTINGHHISGSPFPVSII